MTKNHPIEALSLYRQMNDYFSGDKDTTILCPQALALLIEEVKGYPYREIFYPAFNQIEEQKDEIASKHKNVIIVGSAPTSSRAWYDIIVGIDNKDIKDYDYDEDFNIHHYEFMKLKSADVIFETEQEIMFFINKMMRIEKENEI